MLLDGHSWQVETAWRMQVFRTLLCRPPCHGGMVASMVAIADSTTTELQNTLIRLFMPDCIVLCSVFCVVLIHALRCNDDD